MIKKIVLLLSITALIFIAACSKSDNSVGNNDGGGNNNSDTTNYFPNTDGNYYKYSVDRTDSTGTQSTGTSSSTFSGNKTILNTVYQIKVDTTTLSGISTTSESYLRKSDATSANYGVYVYLDTSGISDLIPDSLLQYLDIGNEMILYSFPFTDGKTWPVLNVKLNFGVFVLTLVSLNGTYEGEENVNLNLVSGSKTMSAAKIRYDLTLTIPDVNNIFGTPTTQVFTAHAWLVKKIGPVKWDGNAALLNAVVGGDILLADTTGTLSQSLIDYKLK